MPLTACTIQEVLSTDNPNQGRVKINSNFECLESSIYNLQVEANTGSTIVLPSTNINTSLFYSGITPVYSISVVNDPIFNSLSASSISADTYYIGSTSLELYLSGNSLFTSGSSGSYSVKANNNSGIDAIGNYSLAQGYNTLASGDSSSAQGRLTLAGGLNSHAEGYSTSSMGINSHAEGGGSLAIGDQSHAEGASTISFGIQSHSEGSNTTAIGIDSHAEGTSTIASGDSSHAEGQFTTAISNTSHAEGGATIASGDYSHAEGYLTITSGNSSHAEGSQTTAIGDYSHTEGCQTTAVGNASHGEGDATTAFGQSSHAEGSGSYASGATSHAEGNGTTSVGAGSHAEGTATTSLGNSSHAEGSATISTGNYSHAEGYQTISTGNYSHAEGNSSTSQGSISHAEGNSTKAIGDQAHSEGFLTIASGGSSHAQGRQTTAIGDYSHTEGHLTTSIGGQSHAGGYNSISSGATSFVHSTNSLVTGARSVVLGGQNITGTTADTVYVPMLNVQTIGSGTPITSLAVDSSGMVVSGASFADLGKVLFVSENGNDNSGQKGNINKPWRNIYSAKSASTSGDTIYVLPGTWTYDNRNSAGNPYNGQIETKVNLWKNGVTYYFTPGAKIKFYNQTVSGQIMYLFNPANVSGETCTVLGGLDWEGYSTGPDSFNGHTTFFWADSSNDSGFTFSAEVKKLSSFGSEIYRLNRLVTFSSDTVVANFRLNADELYHQYVGGQSGAGATEFISGSDAVLNAYINVRERTKTTVYHMFQITGNFTRSNINFFGDKLIHSANYTSIFLRSFTGVVNMNIKNMYWYGTFIQTQVSGGGTFNVTGDLNDYYRNVGGTGGVMYLTTANNTINFKGNITTNTGSGIGRYIAATTQPNNINIDGDIQFLGSATTTQVLFQPINGSVVNYSGKILGTYGGPIAQTYTGTININNSFIQSRLDSSSAQIFQNGGSSSGTCRINNSYVEMRNNSNALANGSYVKALVSNSTIINTGTGTTLANTTNFGSLQLINSTIITSGVTSINYPNTGTSVVSSNSVANTNYNISNVYGTFNVINELTY